MSVNGVQLTNGSHADAVSALKTAGNTVHLHVKRLRAIEEEVIDVELRKGNRGRCRLLARARADSRRRRSSRAFAARSR